MPAEIGVKAEKIRTVEGPSYSGELRRLRRRPRRQGCRLCAGVWREIRRAHEERDLL